MTSSVRLSDAMFEVICKHIMEMPDKWVRQHQYIYCKDLDVRMHIGSGRGYLSVEVDNIKIGLPLIWRWRLWAVVEAHAALVVVSRAEKSFGLTT